MSFLKSDLLNILIFALLLIPLLSLFVPIILFVQRISPCNLTLYNICFLIVIAVAAAFLSIVYITASIISYAAKKIFRNEND